MPDSNIRSRLLSEGTQVVAMRDIRTANDRLAHPAGALGVIVRVPTHSSQAYQVRFGDGVEVALHSDQLVRLADYKTRQTGVWEGNSLSGQLLEYVIFRCVIGSRAYGLDDESSDTDIRGIYLPPAHLHWSLSGVPEQIEEDATQEVYWELQKFLVLALKANPNVLECLYSPIVLTATPLGRELLAMKEVFLSKLLFQTYSGYVASQFKKMQVDIRNQGSVEWKHVMHLIRLLISGIYVLQEHAVNVEVGDHREALLRIRHGEMPFQEVNRWRLDLQRQFELAYQTTTLPDRPDFRRANDFLIRARQSAVGADVP
ncbi:nucleotidyltransferase domain-containing protein [Aureliella helgolandensis]|uniref:Putative nucleotidyltransferase n=1 Tax=Aureliella helgolandensis TaxID=2527968 RepID=A0A518GA48_9BACT|nr:nucleotidyltransferase domain-containing protein [Aureliella helgolandensis]QDV25443.1 putative nucleotidyltransferase [Aureliella helgolandensis]